MGFIYVITHKKSGKAYVGQTRRTVAERWRRHCWRCTANSKMPIALAIAKYGADSFEIQTIEECEDVRLNEREVFHVNRLNTFAPNGYNLRAGDGRAMSEETRTKLRVLNTGRVASAEARANMSKAHLGKRWSAAQREKVVARMAGQRASDAAYQSARVVCSKIYALHDPNGSHLVVRNLKQFCRSKKLLYSKMNEVANAKRTQHKGWTPCTCVIK